MLAAPFPLAPERSALVVVDMQNDFVREGAPQEVPAARDTIPVIASLIAAYREAERPVMYTRFTAGPERTLLWNWSPECGPELRSCWPGEVRRYADRPSETLEGHAVIDELGPLVGEPVVDKYGYGGFHNTHLEEVLRAHAITQVVLTGTVTQICVEETAREGFHRGLEVVVVRDGVSSFDDELAAATLRNLEMKFGRVEPSSTVLAAISGRVDITAVIER
jgi:nicotinamidase-related amidase